MQGAEDKYKSTVQILWLGDEKTQKEPKTKIKIKRKNKDQSLKVLVKIKNFNTLSYLLLNPLQEWRHPALANEDSRKTDTQEKWPMSARDGTIEVKVSFVWL